MATALVFAWTLNAAAQPTDAYLTEIVTIPNGELRLRALLARPPGDGPFPVYIQNHGSMTIEEARRNPWTSITRDSLSDTLARNGYVVLLLARRGYKGSDGTASTYTQNGASGGYGRSAADVMLGAEEETGDVIAALDYLSALAYVDKERVGVGGVSLGGLVSVMAVARDPRFKALISMVPEFQQNRHYLFSRPEGYPLFVPDAMRFLDRHLKR